MAQASPDEVQVLLHGGANLAERDAGGLTPLHHAVGNPNVRVLETLLEYGADPNLTDFEGRQVLEFAAGRADRRVHAEALVRFRANFDELDATVRASLGLTSPTEVLAGVPIERLLGSDWAGIVSADGLRSSLTIGDGETTSLAAIDLQALFRQVLETNRDPSTALLLIEHGAELGLGDGVHALHIAALNANPAVVQALLDREDPTVLVEADADDRTALHYAAMNENPAVARLLLDRGADANAAAADGQRVLHVAALNADPAVAGLLLDRGAELEAQDGSGRRALHVAVLNENPAVLRLLLDRGADSNAEDADGQTALDRAVDQGSLRVIEALRVDGTLSTAEVFRAVAEQPRQTVAGLLSEVPQELLNLYLRVSLLNPDAGVALLLLEQGAEVGPVRLAALNPNPVVTELLLDRGADANAEDGSGRRALHVAALNANPAVARLLLDRGAELEAQDGSGRRALHVAVLNTNPAVAELLLTSGAEVGARDEHGRTALHFAALNANPAVAQLLLDRGAELEAQDGSGRRALHVGALNANPAVSELLLDRGAELAAQDAGSATPLMLAWLNPRSAVPAVFLRAGMERTELEDRLLDIPWLSTATAPELLAQVANALPGSLRRRDEECGRGPIHLVAYFAARNNLDSRLEGLDVQTGGEWNEAFRALLERGVSIDEVDGNGNGVLHYAVAGAARARMPGDGQTFPSAGMEVLRDLQSLGADFQTKGAGGLWPIHYAQPGRPFVATANSLLVEAIEAAFRTPATIDPASGLASERFLPSTDSCVLVAGEEQANVTVGSSVEGRISAVGEVDQFRFEVSEETWVELFTTGATDTFGRLGSASDDDSGDGSNFRIEASVSEGAHFVQVSGFETETGYYTLHIIAVPSDGTPIQTDDHGDSREEATQVTVGLATEGALGFGDEDWFRFETTRGISPVVVYTVGDTDVVGELITSTGRRIGDSSGGSGGNFRIETVVPSGTHYVRVRGQWGPGDDEVGNYTLLVDADDHGDSREEATRVTLGAATDGVLGLEDDEDWFRFTTPVPVSVSVFVASQAGGAFFLVELIDSSGQRTGGHQAEVSARVPRGTHFVRVRAFRQSTGVYTMSVLERSTEDAQFLMEFEQLRIPGRRVEMGKYEVTQGQWTSVMGANPAHFSACGWDCPVESVSASDVEAFIGVLNRQEAAAGSPYRYRLPTAEEWLSAPWRGGERLDEIRPVGRERANAWGLHGMNGSVWEWTRQHLPEWKADHPERRGPW